jgi:hypothetical protein
MPMATEVNLPKDHDPIFPDRCVACGAEHPTATLRISTHSIGWWTVLLGHFGMPFTTEVPACPPCRRRIRLQRWLRFAITIAFVFAGASIALAILKNYRGLFRKWLAMAIAIVCLLPFILWETFFPPPIDLTAYSETVDYEFRDPEYAAEFAELNQGAVSEHE